MGKIRGVVGLWVILWTLGSVTTSGDVWADTAQRKSLRILGTGDVNLDPRFTKIIQKYGYGWVWHGLNGIFKRDDLTVINLECSITTRGKKAPKSFTFRAPPEALKAVKAAGVEVANLGNNHSQDYGVVGMMDTLKYLKQYGIKPVGVGKNLAQAMKPALFNIKGWRIAVVGFGGVVPGNHWLAGPNQPGMASGDDIPTMVRSVKAAKKVADLVIVTIHWGIELTRRPPPEDVVRAKAMIDAGADIIFGHHAHRLQPLEFYKGRPIFWSLGNFIWPRRLTPGARTAIAEVLVSPNKTFKARFIPSKLVSTGRPALYAKRRRLPRRFRKKKRTFWTPTPHKWSITLKGEASSSGSSLCKGIPPRYGVLRRLRMPRNVRRDKALRKHWLFCRDPWREVSSQERHLQRFVPYMADLGGGFVGVGGEHNLTLMAWAQPRLAWIFVENPVAYDVMRLQLALLGASPERKQFLRRWWGGRAQRKTQRLLRTLFNNPKEQEAMVRLYRKVRWRVRRAYQRGRWLYRKHRPFRHWLQKDDSYRYIQAMVKHRRLRLLRGDIASSTWGPRVGGLLTKAKLPLRALYLSDRMDSSRACSDCLARNVLSLPMDKHSVVLRTHRSSRYGRLLSGGHIYLVQGGRHWQALLLQSPRYQTLHNLMALSQWVPKGMFVIAPPPLPASP